MAMAASRMDRPQAWIDYEKAVMEGRSEEAEAPGDDYVMSPEFEKWLVDKMRNEVLGQALGAVADIRDKQDQTS